MQPGDQRGINLGHARNHLALHLGLVVCEVDRDREAVVVGLRRVREDVAHDVVQRRELGRFARIPPVQFRGPSEAFPLQWSAVALHRIDHRHPARRPAQQAALSGCRCHPDPADATGFAY